MSFLRKAVLYVVCVVGISVAPQAVYASQLATANKVLQSFCEKLPDTEAASRYIISQVNFGNTSSSTEIKDQEIQFKNVLDRVNLVYGNYVSCHPGNELMIGDTLLRLDYVLIHELRPMLLQAHFAKKNGKWIPYQIDVSDEQKMYPYQAR
jgi:hypothetical protein